MPPDTPTARAHVVIASALIWVAERRNITQSGSLSHRLRCMNDRASVLRHPFTVAGSAVS